MNNWKAPSLCPHTHRIPLQVITTYTFFAWRRMESEQKRAESLHVSNEFPINLHNHQDLWLCADDEDDDQDERARQQWKKSPSKWPFYICTMYDQRPISEAANVDIFHPLILGIFSSGANSNQADRKYATCKGVETTLKFSRRELNLEMNIITMVTQREMCKLFRLCLDQLSPLTWSIFHYLIFQFPKNYKGEVENHRENLRQIQKYTLFLILFKTPSTSFVRHSALLSWYCFRQFAFG